MNNLIALTEADKAKLKMLNRKSKLSLQIFGSVTAAAAITVAAGFVFSPTAVWPQIAILFVLLFAFATFMGWRSYNKVGYDIQHGMKQPVAGVVSKKVISRGGTTYQYDAGSLARAALREEEEETGKPITRYGVLDQEIDQMVGHGYNVEINKVYYDIGVRKYLEVEEGDRLELEVGPKSQKVISFKKV
jgi:hypothetical protein